MSARAPFTPSRPSTGTNGPDRPLNLSGLKRPASTVAPPATPSKPGTGGHARQVGLAQMKRVPPSPALFKAPVQSQAQSQAMPSTSQMMLPPPVPQREIHAPRAGFAPQMSSPRLDDDDSGYMSNLSGFGAQEDDGDESDAMFRFGTMSNPTNEAPTQVIDLEANSPPPPASKRPIAPTDTNDFAARAAKRRRPDVSPSYFGRAQPQHVQERPSTGQPHPSSQAMLPIPVQARPHSSQSQRPTSQQSQHSQPPQHVSQRQPTPGPDAAGALFRRIMPLAPEQAAQLSGLWEREHAKWSKGTLEEWEQGGDELKERFNGLIERVISNLTRKTSLYADLHTRLASHRSALDARGRDLADARQALVQESRSIAGGGSGGGGSGSSGGGGSAAGSSLLGGGSGGSAVSGSGSGGRSGSSPGLGESEGSDD